MLTQWRRRSSSARVHTRSPSFVDPTSSAFHHSLSLKDLDSLLPGPLPGPSPNPSPARCSLKDVQALISEPDGPGPDTPSSVFHRAWAWARKAQAQAQAQGRAPPNCKARVVVYYTSLRVVRRTYEDCRAVRSILSGYRVRTDERDLSMDGAYVEEIESIVGEKRDKVVKMLPLVYVNGKHVGGVEEIKRMHECGDLKRLLQGVPTSGKTLFGGCGRCGGCRYVVCEHCDGSHKVYVDKIHGFRSCHVCNVSGLLKCPSCSFHFS